jgi:acyl-CoA synthetase (AMP-forming)/AMP-acid ligase II
MAPLEHDRDAVIKADTLGGVLLRAEATTPAVDALVIDGHKLSYADLAKRAKKWAAAFSAMGVDHGDHVGLLLPTSFEFVEAMFGLSLIGAVTVPMNARYAPDELKYVTANADLVAVVTTDQISDAVDFCDRLAIAFPELPGSNAKALSIKAAPKLRSIIVCGAQARGAGFLSESEFKAAVSLVEPAPVGADDLAIILYTSGTTANPKGCLLKHGALVGNSRALAQQYALTAVDRFWSPLPIYHIAGILPLTAIADCGGAYFTTVHFDAGVALQSFERDAVTVTYPCFVTIMQDLIDHPGFKNADLSSIRLMNSNLAVQPDAIREAIVAAMPNTAQLGTYGLSEACGTITTSALDDDEHQRTHKLGCVMPGWEVRIMSFDGNVPCGLGEKGEIWAKGPGLFSGYYRDAEKTNESLTSDGWLRTGDIGSLDKDGQMMFHGRVKDMLKVGGENVAAAEIEAVLDAHPAVKMSQVVAARDDRYDETPAAFVELNEGTTASEEELIAFCHNKIARFKIPRYVRFVTEWPMSTTKIQKFALKQQIDKELFGA